MSEENNNIEKYNKDSSRIININRDKSGEEKRIQEKEALLDDFIDSLLYQEEEEMAGMDEIASDELTIEDYPEIEIDDSTALKIKELHEISESIEKKYATLPAPPNMRGKQYMINYKQLLNDSQLIAATTLNGPLLVIAGAGSGKTRVITFRVSFMLENNIDPNSILLLTFTRKAAAEMLSRVEQLHHSNLPGRITGGTFHSFASLVLRRYADMINIPRNFTIIDTADAEDIVDLVRTQLQYNKQGKKFPKKKRIFKIISAARNRNISIKEMIERHYEEVEPYIKDIEVIFKGYTRYKEVTKTFDFDDLMEVLRNKLRDNQDFRKRLQETYKFIMVDEFQDTNVVQKDIIDLLGEKYRNIMVVGDDAQSIYAFRGANYENILRFPQTYPDCRVVKIEQNYRSNQYVLDFTNDVIGHAVMGYKKRLYSQNDNKKIPVVKRFHGQQDEAEFIVDRILELREQNIPLNQMAVLNRADWHNRFIQVELNKRNIPFVVVGGFRFHERMHVKDMMAFLKITHNPYDAISWHRILKLLPGIGKTIAGRIVKQIGEKGMNDAFDDFKNNKYYDDLQHLEDLLNKASDNNLSIPEKLEVIRNYYAPIMESRDLDYKIRLNDIDALIDLSRKYRSMDAFLSDFALEPPSKSLAGKPMPVAEEAEDEPLVISTIHSAKGLEWYAVFVPHALDGMIPSNRAAGLEGMEEERRLFYVACSRAKEELYITYPAYVASYNAYFAYPSRFLAEVNKNKYLSDKE
jgi:DNA helicase-2/ATP-dependent DNA helicase PcrA